MASVTLAVPADFKLARDLCSYGYFALAPNRWNVDEQSLSRAYVLQGKVCGVRITQPRKHLKLELSRRLKVAEQEELFAQVSRMLRLEMTTAEVAQFHLVDPRWKRGGRARLVRSPTLFEDVIKTVMSCNVTWQGTVGMCERLCAVLGKADGSLRTFPQPAQISACRPSFLRTRCRLGYRDVRIVELARLWKRGAVDEAWLNSANASDNDVYEYLLELPGIGPYAAANVMQLLGRYGRLPCDTEMVRHGRNVLGFSGSSASIERHLRAHYEPMGQWKFLSYWLELWSVYEKSRGPAWKWEPKS